MRLGAGFGVVLVLMTLILLLASVVGQGNEDALIARLTAANQKESYAGAMKMALLENAIAMRNIGLSSDVAAMQSEGERPRLCGRRHRSA